MARKKTKTGKDPGIFDDDVRFLEGFKNQFSGYYVEFFDLVGSLSAAIFLTQCFYWQKKMFKKTGDAGYWWWKPQDSWHEDTRLSKKQQRAARKKLGEDGDGLNLVSEERRGRDGKLYFRLNTERLRTLLQHQRDALGSDLSAPRRFPKGTSLPSSSSVNTSVTGEPSEARSPIARKCDAQSGETKNKRQKKNSTPELPVDPSISETKTYVGPSGKRETIAQKAASKAAEKERGARGALGRLGASGSRRPRGSRSSGQSRPRREMDPYERAEREANADQMRNNPIRRAHAKRKAAVDPGEDAPFVDVELWAREKVRSSRRGGGGIKSPSEWSGGDLDGYLIDLVVRVLPNSPIPDSTGKSRGQAKNLVVSIGGERARDLVAFSVANWEALARDMKIAAYSPTCGIILGYLESIKAFRVGKPKKTIRKTGADRVATKAEYDAEPSEGWA